MQATAFLLPLFASHEIIVWTTRKKPFFYHEKFLRQTQLLVILIVPKNWYIIKLKSKFIVYIIVISKDLQVVLVIWGILICNFVCMKSKAKNAHETNLYVFLDIPYNSLILAFLYAYLLHGQPIFLHSCIC